MKKAFTLIELLVAMAVLALMIAFASMVFSVSIDTYRASTATTEIMQKLRAVTDQLDTDFKGLRRDAPLLIEFNLDDPNRYDKIMFFAEGDFSSIQVYNMTAGHGHPDPVNGDTVIRGNVARVFYGQASVNGYNPGASDEPKDPKGPKERKRILARRQHILTDDQNVEAWPNTNVSDLGDKYDTDNQTKEDRYEHDRLSLARWKIIEDLLYDAGNSVRQICFETPRPQINTSNSRTFHKLLCEGVGSFAIQWSYWDDNDKRFYWFPSTDPDGPYGGAVSHFSLMTKNRFGVYFNIPGNNPITDWSPISAGNVQYRSGQSFAANFFPAALKFTFTLYDSKGVIKDGMVFSHIVYLEQ